MRGKYKRKKLNKYKKFITEYRNNPVKYAEDMLDVKLLWYQKAILNIMSKKN